MSSPEKKGGNLIGILTMFALYGMCGFVTFLAAPAGDIWKYQPGLAGSNALGMMGLLMNFTPYLFFGVIAGNLLLKLGYKKMALLAVGSGLTGILLQWASSVFLVGKMAGGFPANWFIYLVGAFVSGVSNCFLNTVINPMLNTLGGGGLKGNRLNLGGGTFQGICMAACPVLIGSFVPDAATAKFADIGAVLLVAAAVFAVSLVVIAFLPIANPAARPANLTFERSPLAFRHCLLGVIGIFLYMGIESGVGAELKQWLSDPQISPLLDTEVYGNVELGVVAGNAMGLFGLMMLVGRLLGTIFGGKVSPRAMLLTVSGLGVVCVSLGMLLGADSVVTLPLFAKTKFVMTRLPIGALFFILCGLCASVMWGVIFNLSVEGLGKYTEKASGLFMMMVVGGGILPTIMGKIANVNFMASFAIPLVCFIYLLVYALFFTKNVNTDIKVD